MKRNSERDRRTCLETHLRHDERGNPYMICHISKLRIHPMKDEWRADHIKRFAEGGDGSPENLWPILKKYDVGVDGKAAKDTREVAKGKRVRDKAFGIKRKSGFRRAPPGMRFDWTAGRYVSSSST